MSSNTDSLVSEYRVDTLVISPRDERSNHIQCKLGCTLTLYVKMQPRRRMSHNWQYKHKANSAMTSNWNV